MFSETKRNYDKVNEEHKEKIKKKLTRHLEIGKNLSF
jgi:hypothetical protein